VTKPSPQHIAQGSCPPPSTKNNVLGDTCTGMCRGFRVFGHSQEGLVHNRYVDPAHRHM
jgi:hypothetical protein